MIAMTFLNKPLVDMRLNSFGYNLRVLRKTNNETQKELAKEFDVSVSYISRIENDKIQPSDDFLRKVPNFIDQYYIDKFGWGGNNYGYTYRILRRNN
jgi:transcriptional regulator with XRE-family HTH domain